MGNKLDHRGPETRRNDWRQELPDASGTSGEGHNGQIGRSKWKTLSRRSERRALKTGKERAKIFKKRRFRKSENSRQTVKIINVKLLDTGRIISLEEIEE